MDKVLAALAQVGEIKFQHDDDFVDRLSRTYTTFFLGVFALLVSTKQYVGDPISCWCPAEFTESHMEYTNKVCWVTSTYFLPFEEKIPDPDTPRKNISYYQWVPVILIAQGILFYIPCVLWRIFNKKSGVDVKLVMEAAQGCQKASLVETRTKLLKYLTYHLDGYLGTHQDMQGNCWQRIKSGLASRCGLVCGKLYGNYLVMLYLNIKILYLSNSIGQLFLLNAFLGTDYHLYGIHVMKSLVTGRDWTSSERFPRVTLCDFKIRQLANVLPFTVQCVLPINLFNEKIYIFIWFWFVFLAIVTAVSFAYWVGWTIYRPNQVAYVKKQLKAMDRFNRETDIPMAKFTKEYLRQDGIFVIRLVSKNAGDIVAAELLCMLWDNYCKENRLFVDGLSSKLSDEQV